MINSLTGLRALLILALIMLPEAALAMYQKVARIACPDGKFVIEGRVDANIKFIGSQVRYRYRGVELTAINYEQYPYLIRDYLYADIKPDHIYELSTPYRFNPTLYIPPGKFSKEEFDRLADCLNQHQDVLSRAPSKTLYGLLYWVYPVTSSVWVNGITRLIYAHSPIRGLYHFELPRDSQRREDDRLMLIERYRGRVLLVPIPYSKPSRSNEPDRRETIIWGHVHQPYRLWSKPKPRLSLRPLLINGTVIDSETAKADISYKRGLNGRRLGDDYHIVP